MKSLIFIILLLPIFSFAQGVTYYVSNAGSNSNNGLTTGTSWQTLVKVRSALQSGGTVHAGDTIKFKKGDTFICQDAFNGCQIWGPPTGSAISGTVNAQITWDSYGTGSAPNFLFPNPASTDTTNRNVLSFEGVQYYVIKNLQFNDTRRANSKMLAAWTLGVVFGERGSGQETYHCKIDNCYWNNCGMGVIIVGGTDSITNCTMENFGNDFAIGSGSFGANGVTISGNHHYIGRNTISGAFAYSSAFGLNGGAIEMFNTCDTNLIEYNNFWDNGAVVEMGALAGASTFKFNLFQFNKLSNNGNIAYTNVNGPFTGTPTNNRFLNNVIIENKESRYSGINYGEGIDTFPTWPTLPSRETKLFQNNGSPSANPVWNLQNNIIYNTNNMKVFQSSGIVNHKSNLCFFTNGSAFGYTADPSELSTSAKVFFDTTNINPALWDVHMPVNFISAQSLGGIDWDGKSAPVRTGVYYTLSTPPEPNIMSFPANVIYNGVGTIYTGWRVGP